MIKNARVLEDANALCIDRGNRPVYISSKRCTHIHGKMANTLLTNKVQSIDYCYSVLSSRKIACNLSESHAANSCFVELIMKINCEIRHVY